MGVLKHPEHPLGTPLCIYNPIRYAKHQNSTQTSILKLNVGVQKGHKINLRNRCEFLSGLASSPGHSHFFNVARRNEGSQFT
jgi:hypothetical protein